MKKTWASKVMFVLLFLLSTSCVKDLIENPNFNAIKDSIPADNIPSADSNKELFFSKGSAWKYLDDGSNQKLEWTTGDFDDKDWKVGAGHFGFGDGDEDVVLQKGFLRYFFRKKIVIDDVNLLPKEVLFNIVHDDAAIVYINGKEVLRSALLPQTGDIPHDFTLSTFIPNNLENSFFEYYISSSFFKNGDNTIAIEIRNQNKSSSDVSFDCFVLKEKVAPFHADGPYVFYENGGVTVSTITDKGLVNTSYALNDNITITVKDPTSSKNFSFPLKKTHAIPSDSYELPKKVFITSDIEGQFSTLKKMLIDGKVMNENFEWIFGQGHLFVNGDMVDRGEYVTEVLWLIYKLDQEAEKAGGKLHYILGNHEAMVMANDNRYVHSKYVDNALYLKRDLNEFFDSNSEFGKYFRSKNIIERMGDYTVVHGGISPAVAKLGLSYTKMNEYGRKKINNESCTGECAVVTGGSASGLYWYRGMANEDLSGAEVGEILKQVNTKKVIIGHTVFPIITTLYDGRIVAMDVNHVKNIADGKVESLIIENDCFKRFLSNSVQKTELVNLYNNCK